MSLDLGTMYAAVSLDDGDFQSGLNRMQHSADSVFKKIAAAAASYLSWRSVAAVTSAFMTQQDAVEGVRSALRNVGSEIDANAAKFANFAKEMQKITRFGDESTLAAMSQGMRLGIDPAQIESVTKSAMGLSQKLGIDLPSSMQLLARASKGHTEMLARYGISLDQNLSKEEQYQQILKQGADSFSLVTDAAKTASGSFTQMANAIGDSKEAVGKVAVDALLPAVRGITDLANAFNNLDPATQKMIVSVGTLGAALAALSGFGILEKGNAIVSAAAAGLSNTKLLLDAEKAAEEEKRAEYAKTDAMKERHAQAQMLRIARIKRAEAEQSVVSAKVELNNANPSDIAAVTAAKRKLAEAENNLTKAQIAESKATQGLTDKHRAAVIASRQHAAAAQVNAAAQKSAAASMTVSGRAALFARGAYRAAATAAKGLVAALGPVGISMLAISAAYSAVSYIQEKHNNQIQGELNLARQQSSQVNELAEAHRKEAEAETASFKRLQELAGYERMNNAEKDEAKKLIDQLQQKYGTLGIELDTVNGKLKIGAQAWDKMSEAQRKNARLDLLKQQSSAAGMSSALQNSLRNQLGSNFVHTAFSNAAASIGQFIAPAFRSVGIKVSSDDYMERRRYSEGQNRLDDIFKLKTAEEQITALEKFRNDFLAKNKKTEADAVNELIKSMKTELALKKQLESGGQEADAEKKRAAAEKAKQESEELLKAMNELTNTEWQIKFNIADASGQLKMLDDKIKEIFDRQSGKYSNLDAFQKADRSNMTKEELNDLRSIVELQEKQRAIRERGKQTITGINETDQQAADRRNQSMQDRLFNRQLEQLRENGQLDRARELLNKEYEAAKSRAEMLEKQYASAKQQAVADGLITEQENKALAEARRKMQEAQQRQDALEGQVYQENKKQKSTQVVAAWSVAALSAQLYGNSSPEKQIARNTQKSSTLLTNINSKVTTLANNSNLAYS